MALRSEPGTDAEDAERLGRQLRDELRELDVDEVVQVTATEEPPPGSKGVAAPIAEWLVTMSASGGAVALLVGTVRDWLARRSGGHTVTVTMDGDTLELSGATPGERDQVIETFLRRHQAG